MLEIFLFLGILISVIIGSNDVIGSLGISYGTRILNMRTTVLLAILFTFIGAFFLGNTVMQTVGKSISPIVYPFPAALSALIVAAAILYFRLPTSITQIVIGSIIGSSLATGVNVFWDEVGFILLSWTISPVIVMLLSVSLYYIYIKSFLGKGTNLEMKLRMRNIFIFLQIVIGSLLAMAIAGNNVGVAMGLGVDIQSILFLEIIGAAGLSIGIATWGRSVIRAIMGGLTQLTPEKAFFAQLSGLIVLLFFVLNGIPVSPTALIIAAIMGVGLVSRQINGRRLNQMLFTWVLIIPVSILSGFFITSLFLL